MDAPAAPVLRRELPRGLRPNVRAALVEAKAALEALYGDRLVRVILYGSQARGDAREDSDVDLLLVLRGKLDPYREIKRAVSAVWGRALVAHEVVLALNLYDEDTFSGPPRPFIRNVLEDGVDL